MLPCFQSPEMLIFRLLERVLLIVQNQYSAVVKNLALCTQAVYVVIHAPSFLSRISLSQFLKHWRLGYLPYKMKIVILAVIIITSQCGGDDQLGLHMESSYSSSITC